MSRTHLFAASVLGSLLASGCTVGAGDEGAPSDLDLDQVGDAEGALASEMVNGSAAIVHAAGQYYSNPDVAVNQWAEASFNGTSCNGVMIGPNTYFIAAHCGAPANVQILFRTYRNGSSSTSDTEAFTCNELIQTFNDTDGAVFYCAPNAAGQNPGDKYGYVDFDVTAPTVGQQIYSISANPAGGGSVAWDARMYVTGQVTSVTDNGWFVPNSSPNTGIVTNLWAEPGMSGSPHFNAANHRMIIAPLSVGGGWLRGAASMSSLLFWGYVNPAFDPAAQGPTVNTAFVTSLGLTPATYYGWADKNLDYEFDVQYDLERLRGEARRGWYWLGFESPRKNSLWDAVANTTFDVANRQIRINKTSGAGYADALYHRKLNLTAGAYRVSLMTYTNAASAPNSLWVSLKSGASYVGGEYVPNTVGSGWQMHTFNVTAASANAELVLGARGTADVLVMALSVVKQGEAMDFDTHDKRWNWRNDITGARATVVPDGRTTGTPNWAMRVTYSAAAPLGYPVRNRQLAMVGGRSYRVCFDQKREGASTVNGEVRVVSGAAAAVSIPFGAAAAWATTCSATFSVPSDDNSMQMRVSSAGGSYLVDNLTITEM